MFNIKPLSIFLLFLYSIVSFSLDDHTKNQFNLYCINGDYKGVVEVISSLGNNEEAIKGLLNTPDNEGHTPLFYAVGGKSLNIKSDKIVGSKDDRYNIIKYLSLLGANPNIIGNNKSFSPLHMIVTNQDAEILEVFLRSFFRSVDVNIVDQFGSTPLHYAVSHTTNNNVTRKLLGFYTIDLIKLDKDGQTALDLAALISNEHWKSILQLYIDSGHGLDKKISTRNLELNSYQIKSYILRTEESLSLEEAIKKKTKRDYSDKNCKTVQDIVYNNLKKLIESHSDLSSISYEWINNHYNNNQISNLLAHAITYGNYYAFKTLLRIYNTGYLLQIELINYIIIKDKSGDFLQEFLSNNQQIILTYEILDLINKNNNYNTSKVFYKFILQNNYDGIIAQNRNRFHSTVFKDDENIFKIALELNAFDRLIGNKIHNYAIEYKYNDVFKLLENMLAKEKLLSIKINDLSFIQYLCKKYAITLKDYFLQSNNFIKLLLNREFEFAQSVINLLDKEFDQQMLYCSLDTIIVNDQKIHDILKFLLSNDHIKNIFKKYYYKSAGICHNKFFYELDNFEDYLTEFDVYNAKDMQGFNTKDYLESFVSLNYINNDKVLNLHKKLPEGVYKPTCGIDSLSFANLLMLNTKLSKEILDKINDKYLKILLIKKHIFIHLGYKKDTKYIKDLLGFLKELPIESNDQSLNKIVDQIITLFVQSYDLYNNKKCIICVLEVYEDKITHSGLEKILKIAIEKNDFLIKNLVLGMLSTKQKKDGNNNLKRKKPDEDEEENNTKKRKLNDV